MTIDGLRELLDEIENIEMERDRAQGQLKRLGADCREAIEIWFGKDTNGLRHIGIDNLIAHMHRELPGLPGLRASQERRRELELEKDPDWQP